MQARKFFTFGMEFNILTDSMMVAQESNNVFPPTANYLITEDGNQLITENSNNLITET